jgi:ribonucleotide reductase alpha subunit
MKDLEKAYYTVEEINNERASKIHEVESYIESCYQKFFSEDEKLIISEAGDIIYAPYHYSINKDAYICGKENEAVLKEIKNMDKISKANELKMKFLSEMPENMKTTYHVLKEIHQNRFLNANRKI